MSNIQPCFGQGFTWVQGQGRIKTTVEQCYQCKDFERCCDYIKRMYYEKCLSDMEKRS